MDVHLSKLLLITSHVLRKSKGNIIIFVFLMTITHFYTSLGPKT